MHLRFCMYSFMPIGVILIKSNAELTGLAPGLGSVSETRTVLLMKSLDPYTVKAPVDLVPLPPSLPLVSTMAVNRRGHP